MITAADDYPLLELLWTFVLLFALVVYFWLLITVLGDLFPRSDVSGWGKTAWIVVLVLLPLIGSLAYLITQGHEMAGRRAAHLQRAKQRSDDHIRAVAGAGHHGAEEIARAKELLDQGAITQEEFEQLKRRALV